MFRSRVEEVIGTVRNDDLKESEVRFRGWQCSKMGNTFTSYQLLTDRIIFSSHTPVDFNHPTYKRFFNRIPDIESNQFDMAAQAQNNDNLAYNVHGIAYDHQVDKASEGQIIRVREVTGKMLSERHESTTKTLLVPSSEEQGDTGEPCVWIGMRPKGVDLRPPRKGTPINAIAKPCIIPHDPHALRVVTVLSHTMNKYYALINDGKGGLCQAKHIKADGVFFFTRFRDDDVAAREKRFQEWSRKISLYKTNLKSKEDERSPRSPNQAHAEIQFRQNPINRMKGLIATYLRVSHPEYLDKLQHVLRGYDEELESRPVGSESLILLFDSKEVVTLERAEAAVVEIEVSSWITRSWFTVTDTLAVSLARNQGDDDQSP